MRFALLAIIFWTSFAFADTAYQAADDSFFGLNGSGQDYAKAFELYKQSAGSGNADAMNALGYMHRLGLGTEKDNNEAFKWYQKAAAQKDPYGLFNLSLMYRQGKGTETDLFKSFINLEKAANAGLPEAMNDMGWVYDTGAGVKKNPDDAVRWFTRGAISGSAEAQYNLAMMYRDGKGVQADRTKYLYWLGKSAENGFDQAKSMAGEPVKPVKEQKQITAAGSLVWQDNTDSRTLEMTWTEADRYCRNQNINGFTGWRMPSFKELASIIDKNRTPAVQKSFRNVSDEVYWSSAQNPKDKKQYRVIYFFNGADYFSDGNYYYRVRCVRDK